LQKINAEQAWEINDGNNETVLVGVIDTGINGGVNNGHEDLVNRMSNRDPSLPILHQDYVDPFVPNQIPDDPDSGHGTFAAGIIAAEGDNNTGIAGVAWNVDVELVSLRAFFTYINQNNEEVSEALPQDVISAINFAASNDISILNYSAGSYTYRQDIYTAIAAYDGLFVAGAGNNGTDNDTTGFYPASYDLPNIISVGASNNDDTKRHTSNHGDNTVDIFAPGSNVWSTIPTAAVPSGYVSSSGTSFATPFVTGVAVLIMSIKPAMEPIDIKNCILYSADTITALDGLCVTGGRLNAYEAVKMARDMWEQPTLSSNVSANGTVTASNSITNREPYGAFDGYAGTVAGGTTNSNHPATQWTAKGNSGWIELNLNEYVNVSEIYFYNRTSGGNHRTKNAYFTGTGGVALGSPFVGVNENFGLSVIAVDNVVTNVIRLNITSSHDAIPLFTDYIGANEIRILATPATAPDSDWEQPIFTDYEVNGHGTVSASGSNSTDPPYKAFNGTMHDGDYDHWSLKSTNGWLELQLDYYIKVNSIKFYNGISLGSNRTKGAHFTGTNGIELGSSFTAPNHNFAHVYVPVIWVVTNVIRLNITSSYGTWINVSQIKINGTKQEWEQPTFDSYSSIGVGTITSSSYNLNDEPWRAFDGKVYTDQYNQWSENSTTGYLQLELDYYINIESIEFYNGRSVDTNYTKDAYFTGIGGANLGSPFTAPNISCGRVIVDVGGVETNVIRLNVTSSYGSYINASEIKITGEKVGWAQPVFRGYSIANVGKITSSSYNLNDEPWRAFNGKVETNHVSQWSENSTTGYLQLELEYYVKVDSIKFYNGWSGVGTSHRTKAASFTGTGGIALGDSFTAHNADYAEIIVPVGGILTNVIRLNVSSSYGSWINASEIIINATIPE